MRIKQIPNFPDYFISDTGIVYSVAERANRGKPKKPIMKSQWKKWGYYSVTLAKNKKQYPQYVHRLVLRAFVGECPNGYQCRHLDGNKLNNNLSNLTWGTRRENQLDRLLKGNDNRGEKHGMNKLTKTQVRKIRKLLGKKYHKEIADVFNVHKSTISSIALKRTWGWLL